MKMITWALACTLALGVAGQTPAHADGTGNSGPVGVGVIGSGLQVTEIRATLTGWQPGAKASASLWNWNGTRRIKSVRAWKFTSSREVSGLKFEYAEWKMTSYRHPHGERLLNRTRLCVEFSGHSERACAKIYKD